MRLGLGQDVAVGREGGVVENPRPNETHVISRLFK